MSSQAEEEPSESVPFPHLRVWKAADALEQHGLSLSSSSKHQNDEYAPTTSLVVQILRQWGQEWAGNRELASLLHKRSLLHEVEESIVALHHLHHWLLLLPHRCHPQGGEASEQPNLTVVDVCCGKGLFSMLLSFIIPLWKKQCPEMFDSITIQELVLLDKATNIDWKHIHYANATCHAHRRPVLKLWKGCNLHDYDNVLDRLVCLDSKLALVGIHLCRNLGPAFVSLVNGLGNQTCPYFCLAPCCLPRKARSSKPEPPIPIYRHETIEERRDRLSAMERREYAIGRARKTVCFVCHSEQHRVRDCPLLPEEQEARIAMLSRTVPCWKCGVVGHVMAECPSNTTRPPRVDPPCVEMNVETVIKSKNPFETYCRLLADTVEGPLQRQQLVEPGLVNMSGSHENDDDGRNWNAARKSIYIVVAR